jgi:hypothetical protein
MGPTDLLTVHVIRKAPLNFGAHLLEDHVCEFHAQGYEMHQTNAMMIVFTQHRSCAYPWSANVAPGHCHGALPSMRTGRCKGTCMELHADRDHAMCNIQNR